MENNNRKDISEVERLKWLISRIDLYHKTTLESIDSSQAIFQNAGKEGSHKIKAWRRGILSVLGVILTVLLGINSFQWK